MNTTNTNSLFRKMLLRGISVFLVFCLSACSTSDAGGPVPRPAPYTRFYLISGEQVPFEQYRGKIVTVVFWGSWCRASKSTVKGLEEIATKVGSQRFTVLAVSLDRTSDEKQLRSVITNLSLDHLQHAYSGNESLDEAYLAFHAEDVPHVFVIDEGGTIVAKGRGDDVVEEYLEKRGLL